MKISYILAIGLIGIALSIWVFNTQYSSEEKRLYNDSQSSTPKVDAPQQRDASAADNAQMGARVADVWQWQEQQVDMKNQDQPLFTEQSVHDALQAVRVDENGNVILDYHAQIALDEALERIYSRLDPESMRDLRDLIEAGLPEPAAQQASQLVSDYYDFLQAKDQFSQMHANAPSAFDAQSPEAVRQDQALYGDLKALRSLHLGSESAEKLFAVADANAEFMFESMRLNADQTLSEQERLRQIQAAESRLQDEMAKNMPTDEFESTKTINDES